MESAQKGESNYQTVYEEGAGSNGNTFDRGFDS